ncbi:MAG: phosphopantothenoylcysteine decarboxylase [Sphaerochaeta sp.]|jgi:phosphopantothenoylcysteine decarboxylase/phosphopantothenoylcysteine decarboxylase/phosphopantothenate--cysteine ligase|nr:phosphopantothenoylcysteine decarboxylase [Sphaerochaeta sp.]
MSVIVLGVSGSIAAYKAADIAHRLVRQGDDVWVILSDGGAKFITPLTFQSLTGHPVAQDLFAGARSAVEHITLAKDADLLLIAPATANVIAKIATGVADDLLTTVVCAAWRKPVVICPAMNTQMYENPIVQKNVETLKRLGFGLVEPRESLLACGDLGKGALAEPEVIVATVNARLGKP